MDNIFFDIKQLRACGDNVIIGKTVRIRYPELVIIGDNCIIDDFTYISTALNMYNNSHISAGCKLIGGKDSWVIMNRYSTLAPGVVLAAGSDDYMNGIATPTIPAEYKANYQTGTIYLGSHCIIGSNSVVLPHTSFEEGACLGALSLANGDYKGYKLYAGIPARYIKDRNKEEILNLQRKYEHTTI